MIYPTNFESKIGFDFVRQDIENKCISPLGLMQSSFICFSSEYSTVIRQLNETNEFLNIISSSIDFPINDFFDVTPSLNSIRAEGSFMSEESLFRLLRSLNTIASITSFFSPKEEGALPYPALSDMCSQLQSFPLITREIENIIDKFGNIKDNATPELLSIKKRIQSTTASINGILRRIITEGRQNGILEKDVAPSVRDGRLVLPVAPMNKRKIKGIVHDESASGKTVFIEPGEIVEANNTIRELEGDMRREIIRILTVVSDFIRPYIDDLLISYEILGKIDFTRAKALFARDINASLPSIEKDSQLEWYHAVHPGLYMSLKEQGKTVVPLNIHLDSNNRILLISGPNAGGKSVCLKTVGIIQYMVQCGILPPIYSNSHVGIFESIFIDIGDEQSLENDLSTYSSHLTNMKYFLSKGNENTIILIDEFGGGTEPQIGGAIAQSILHRMNDKKMFGVITTHYQNLKHFAEDTEGVINGAMLYDRQKMEPLFQLSIGYPGSSFAVEIARKIGLPLDVIKEAEEIAGSDYINMDKYLLDIARDRKYWENKRQDIRTKQKKIDSVLEEYNAKAENINKERNEIIRKAKNEAKSILEQSNSSIERTIHDIKVAQAEKEKTKEIRKQLQEFHARLEKENTDDDSAIKIIPSKSKKHKKVQALEKPKANENLDLKIGDKVKIEGSDTIGEIISIEGTKSTVAFGLLKTIIESKKLKKFSGSIKKSTPTKMSPTMSKEIRNRQLEFKQDIDVRGMRADEAIQAVTYFVNDALQFNAHRVRILHGTGTGILRERIREYLNTIQSVKSFRDEHVQFGGAGITVVDFE